jgi:hypothetical protein
MYFVEVEMSDRWAFSIFVKGDDTTKEEFKQLFMNGNIPDRLKEEIEEDDLQSRDLFVCMRSIVGSHGDQLGWWDHKVDLEEISGWFPNLKIDVDVDGTCEMSFSEGKMISRKGGIIDYDDDFDDNANEDEEE